jgi:hypothetical protein
MIRKRLFVVLLGSLLVLALVAPVAAMAAGTDSYTAYGLALRQTYGHDLGQINLNSPSCYGVKLGHQTAITSRSYGVRLGQYNTLTTKTYGSRLWNRNGNPNLTPYITGNLETDRTVH